MGQLIPPPNETNQELSHLALKALGFVDPSLFSALHLSHSSTFFPSASHLSAQATPGDLRVSIEDWDTLFCAIQWRLAKTVAVGLEADSPTPADDVAGKMQVVVLECVAALELLHTALMRERMKTNNTH